MVIHGQLGIVKISDYLKYSKLTEFLCCCMITTSYKLIAKTGFVKNLDDAFEWQW
jgi:hypothetical protein